ncbi:hypothetical protein [Pelomonas sp. Root1444]|uniref:hypothetical protein n=1 Tax=Pelomonas sp. Root1444 TaxID=1736464 RepID=UPI000703775C|nr:hypothetical protein [Pelomonas sp. Root1444]KQY83641.1 hypothetical protein ASD35_24260 [Pelomonas sp. Root1444]
MTWHLQPTRLTARLFSASRSFEQRDPPDVIAQVDLTADGKAYIHATMSRQDGSTSPGAWRDLVRILRGAFGVTVLDWEHKGKTGGGDAGRAWADTVAVER